MPRLTDEPTTDDPLDDLIHAYLEAGQAGRVPDRQELLDAHPALADDLERFFAAHDEMDRLARPLRDVAVAARVVVAADLGEGPGRRLPIPVEFGAYVLLEVLGTGGMGIVYRAHHRVLNRDVALKQILAGPLAEESDVRRFRNEAEAAAQLRHPNIVAIHDVGEHQGRPYLTMTLIEGGGLDGRLDRFRNDPRTAARLMTVVAGAVHHAHERGILHRDLKPSNILVDGDGRPHVTDFGLARQIGAESTLTGSGAILGSPPYMAPEQAGGRTKEVTTRTDVYGLGSVLYALLTGRPPFRGDSPLETMEQVRSNAPEPPRRLNPRLDRDLETICLKCLEKEPDQRYPSAEAVGADLDRWLDGRPIRARRAGWMRRAVLWARRRPYASAMIAGMTLLFALGFAGILWQWRAAVAAQRATEVALYENRIALADRELSAGEPGRAIDLLDECDPALRGWEWFHLQGRRRFDEAELDGSNVVTVAAAYHPGGTILATGYGEKGIAIWEAGDRGLKRRQVIAAHNLDVTSLAFSSDGRLMVSTSFDGVAKVWDTGRWEVRHALQGRPVGRLWGGAIHPDNRLVALAGWDKAIGLWEPETGRVRLLQGHEDRVTGVAFDRDGRLVASSSDDATVRIWDVETGREIRSHREPGLFSYGSVAFSPDGRSLAASSAGGALMLWETVSGRLVFRRVHPVGSIRRLTFSPDGQRIATAGGEDHMVTIWDASSGRDLLSLHGHTGDVWSVAFRGDGERLASVEPRRLRVWDADRGRDASEPGGLVLRGHAERVDALAFGADGRRIATASWDRSVRLWDPASGRLLQELEGPVGALTCVAFSPDGRLAAAGRDRAVTVWDATGRVRQTLSGHQRVVLALAFSRDGQRLASAGADRVVRIWETTSAGLTLKESLEFQGFIYSLAFSPDDTQLAVAIGAGTVAIREMGAGRSERALKLARRAQRVTGLAYSPDGRHLAFGTESEGLQVWDPSTGRRIRAINGHDGEVLAVTYSPDGRHLASGGKDRTVRIWDAAEGTPLHRLDAGVGEVRGLAFSPDGRHLAATSADKTVRVWDLVGDPLPVPDQETKTAR